MNRNRVQAAAVGTVAAASLALLIRMIHRHVVNVLFADQWDFLAGLREHAGPWRLFSWQHGPHRMGLGYFFIEAVYRLSGWDERVEAYATAALFVLILALVLILKVKAVGPLTWMDACLPALVLSRTQFELFVGTPNAAHGALPLLLVVLAPFCWLIRYAGLRAVLGGLLSFAAAYTGFAIFLVPCLAALFAIDAARPARGGSSRAWDATGAVLCVASLVAFSAGYRFQTAVDCPGVPPPLEYPAFAGLMLLRPLQIGHLIPGAFLVGLLTFLAAVAFLVLACGPVWRSDRTLRARALFLFTSFSVLFVAGAAAGRACLGLDQAFASRYVPYVLPLWLGAFLSLAAESGKRPALVLPVRAGALAIVILQLSIPNDSAMLRHFSEGKARWRACYLATPDEARCNAEAHFRVYPVEGAPQVSRMLEYLREHHLNLFR